MPRTRRTLLIVAACSAILTTTAGFSAWAFPTSVPVARSLVWLFGAEYMGRDGVIMQQGDEDCGIAALQMVLHARGVHPSALEPARTEVLQRRRGATFLELKGFAEQQGVRLTGWRMTLRELARVPHPAIVHLGDHFAVLDHVAPSGHVVLRDPSLGRLRIPPADFSDIWTGDVLLLDPLPRAAPAPSSSAADRPAPAPAPAR